ncbi:DUF7507 domain-containing protein [Planktothricoides raciborskii]|uniref:DUF11 domain-containing protein n=1 Tax=Planktothricoides raciborskii FACHB-1370 TaxID=2949576 RepID=A0ABR8ELS4_9CYAN|nr:DUF11 domain-containing protein [Planktothricoides raciborskii]MBD2547856.1 DUF11 domain-containing protein [Planktothricoides raciborskii FACHB-1370]MBD2586298.1 DUF11 domain-containing protein [Planktothricoides raciborskii FACHB-1261]
MGFDSNLYLGHLDFAAKTSNDLFSPLPRGDRQVGNLEDLFASAKGQGDGQEDPITGAEETLQQARGVAESHLANFATIADFDEKMNLAFGESRNVAATEALAKAWETGDFSGIPEIEIRPTVEINGALGAFAGEGNKIYLSQELLEEGNVGAVANVLLEEIGHGVDWQINVTDAFGDEGAIFSAVVRGESLSGAELQALKAEDDSATVWLDGQLVAIEQAVNAPYSDAGGPEGDTADINLGTKQGTVTLSYETFTIPDRLQLQYEGNVIFDSGFVGTDGFRTVKVPFSGNSEEITSVLTANLDNPNTEWEYTVDVDGCADTTPLNIEVVGGKFEDTDGDGDCDAQGTILIGRTGQNGIPRMLRVEGATAEYDDKSLRITDGTVFSEIGNVAEPLFRGNFEISFNTAVTSSLQETGSLPNEFKLADLDIDFNSISLTPTGIGLGSVFKLPTDLGSFDIQLPAPDTLFIDNNGLRIGQSLKLASNKNLKDFKLFGQLTVKELSDLSLEYVAPEDKLKLQGKLALGLPDNPLGVSEVVADLSGDNFIQISEDANGDGLPEVGINGALTIKRDIDLKKGFGLKDIRITFNNISREFGGGATFKRFPDGLEIGGDFQATYDPWDIKSISAQVDNLNKLIPDTPLFLQGGTIKLDNLDPLQRFSGKSNLPNIELNGGAKVTLGPQLPNPVTIPLPGWAGGDVNLSSLAEINGDLKLNFFDSASVKGEAKILGGLLGSQSREIEVNFKDQFVKVTGGFSALNGLLTQEGSVKLTSKGFTLAGKASVKFPESIPFLGTNGNSSFSGNSVLEFSNDSNLSNDFVAAWRTVKAEKLTAAPDLSITTGIKVFFNGKVEILTRDLPQTNSFTVAPGTQWMVMSADWENPAANAPVQVKAPNGTIFNESDFAANNIAIVDDLTDSTTKGVIVLNPTPGIWDLNVADPAGLGQVQYTAFRDSEAPTIEVTSPATDVSGGQVAINYNAFDADSEAEIALFYDTDNEGFDGVLIADGLQETDGAGNFVWNTEGLPTGDYYIYAMVMDENNPPAFSYSPGRVSITEEADLSVTKTASADPATVGNNLTYTIAVTNNGAVESKGVTLTDTLPEGVTLVSSSIPPATQSDNTLTFDLGNLASGQNATIDITVAPTTEGLITNTASVTSRTFDPDATNDVDILTTTVDAIPVEPTELSVSRTDSPDPANLGENFTYTLTVANNGTTPATDVTLAESLPSAVNLVSANASRGTTSSVAGGLSANLGTLSSGEIATVDITVNPIAAGNLVSTTSVASNEADANTTNNFLIQSQTVNPTGIAPADLELTKTVDNPSPSTGDLVNFALTLTNNGPGVASGIQVTDLLPPELTFVSAASNQGSYDPSTGVWDAGNLRDGLSTPLTITAIVNSGGSITTTAEITATGQADPDSTPGNNNPAEDDQASVSLNGSGGSREFKNIFGIGDPPIVI